MPKLLLDLTGTNQINLSIEIETLIDLLSELELEDLKFIYKRLGEILLYKLDNK